MTSIYLADLVYDTVKTNYVVPLNIGYLAALLEDRFGKDVEIRLFKSPRALESALNGTPPDVIGFSHYSWNTRLNRLFAKMAKRMCADTVTVMGGPNIRIEEEEIAAFMSGFAELDYYILFEGEGPFLELVETLLRGGDASPEIPGCCCMRDGRLVSTPVDMKKKGKTIDYPSPYLSGWMDPFIKDPGMIPLLETNRGCPYGCAYCTWGISALSYVRKRSLDIVFEEIEYIAEHGAGQPSWIFCDANFGIFDRDVQIAEKIKNVRNKKGFPLRTTIWQSKNTTERNIRINELIGDASFGYIAIQSSDPEVLKHTGRGMINMNEIRAHVSHFRERSIPVLTDLLIGLPGESAHSHLSSILDAFDMGFDVIQPYNIRLLPGSKYDSPACREKFGVQTKFRPIFGAYGEYDGQRVFEIEESVRATNAMTENELDAFKVLHWLLYFCWNSRIGRLPLELGRKHGVNPGEVLAQVARSGHPLLKDIFRDMLRKSRDEWFDSAAAMEAHYASERNFDAMVKNFVKLNNLYIYLVYKDKMVMKALMDEVSSIVKERLSSSCRVDRAIIDELIELSGLIICDDLLQDAFKTVINCSGETASIVLNEPALETRKDVALSIERPASHVALCRYHLCPGGEVDISIPNVTRFLEAGGKDTLINKVKLASE